VYNVSKEVKEVSYKHGLKLSAYDIQKQLTDAKKEYTFLKDVHSQTLQSVIERLDNSFKKFFKGAGYPKWASKKKWKSIPFKSIKTTHNAFKLPSFGVVKVFKFKEPKGDLKTATIIKEADGLYLKVVVDEFLTKELNRDSQSVVALDMGVKFFTVTSDGEFVDNPKHLFNKLSELRIQQRKLSRMKKGGSNWNKQLIVVQRLYLKVRRCRLDFLQKQSTLISNNYETVIIEDLNIKGMSKSKKLSKHILDCGWGTFFKLLEYKTNVIKVNPRYSSQECSKCGHTCKENRKTQSLFECIQCGFTENADFQATLNLFQRGQSLMEANVDR
jgi:putative transposase